MDNLNCMEICKYFEIKLTHWSGYLTQLSLHQNLLLFNTWFQHVNICSKLGMKTLGLRCNAQHPQNGHKLFKNHAAMAARFWSVYDYFVKSRRYWIHYLNVVLNMFQVNSKDIRTTSIEIVVSSLLTFNIFSPRPITRFLCLLLTLNTLRDLFNVCSSILQNFIQSVW